MIKAVKRMIVKRFPDKDLVDTGFVIGIMIKGVIALGETLVGLAMIVVTPERFQALIHWITKADISDSPRDWLTSTLLNLIQYYNDKHLFWIFYWLSHGVIKFIVLIFLWKGKLWAYWLGLVVFVGFIIYQMYVFFFDGYSMVMLGLSIFDSFMVLLTALEYRKALKKHRAQPAAEAESEPAVEEAQG